MGRKRHKPEEIVAKLRQVDVLTSQGQSVAEAIRSIGVMESRRANSSVRAPLGFDARALPEINAEASSSLLSDSLTRGIFGQVLERVRGFPIQRGFPNRGLRLTGMTAPMVLDGPINGQWFQAYVDQVLVPTLSPGDIVVMDNLGSHKGAGGDYRKFRVWPERLKMISSLLG